MSHSIQIDSSQSARWQFSNPSSVNEEGEALVGLMRLGTQGDLEWIRVRVGRHRWWSCSMVGPIDGGWHNKQQNRKLKIWNARSDDFLTRGVSCFLASIFWSARPGHKTMDQKGRQLKSWQWTVFITSMIVGQAVEAVWCPTTPDDQ